MNLNAALPRPSSNRSEEKLPLKNDIQGANFTYQGDITFKVIIGCMAAVTLAITIAIISESVYGHSQQYKINGAVVTDSRQCGEIGINILKSGGSSVDAIVAVVFCQGVVLPHLTGLGGAGSIVIRKGGVPANNVSINFLNLYSSSNWENSKDTVTVGVPGVLKGLWTAHQMFGRLSWQAVVQPSVILAADGFLVEPSFYWELNRTWLVSDLRDVFMPNGSSISIGEKIKWPALAETLKLIAVEGENVFYNGSLTDTLIEGISAEGGTLTKDDFASYSVDMQRPLETIYNGYNLLTTSVMSGGPPLILLFRLLQHLKSQTNNTQIKLSVPEIVNRIEIVLERSELLRKELTSGNISDQTIEELASLVENKDSPNVRDTISQSHTVGTMAVASDSQDLHASVVTGLGSPFGWEYITNAGIILSSVNKWHEPQFGNWSAKLVPLIIIKQNRFCQPVIASASNDFRRLVKSMSSYINSSTYNYGPSSSLDEDLIGISIRSNNQFKPILDPPGEGFSAIV
ncbi:hypothetical protein CHUAL_000847 [Chamberlinius hualienensis]